MVLSFTFICLYVCACITVYCVESEENSVEPVLSFHQVGPRLELGVGGKHLYLLNHLADPTIVLFKV